MPTLNMPCLGTQFDAFDENVSKMQNSTLAGGQVGASRLLIRTFEKWHRRSLISSLLCESEFVSCSFAGLKVWVLCFSLLFPPPPPQERACTP
jgi:hypothetical protein